MPVHNLPLPYPDELLYGILSRIRVHLCVQSPKKLLTSIYGHSGMVASMRFGSNLNSLANSYDYQGLTSETLLFKHTLWPLIAPFIPINRKNRCESWLFGQRDRAVTVSSGVAATRLKYPKNLRYCSICVSEQTATFGEAYWQRLHQVPAIDFCLKHKCQLNLNTCDNLQRHQHEFFPLLLSTGTAIKPASIPPFFNNFNDYVISLLNLEVVKTPTFEQWSAYYRELACNNNLNRGQHIKHQEIESLVTNQFSTAWLNSIGLAVDDTETNWTRSIFRKHRKSFSFLEHYIINTSLTSQKWDVGEVLVDICKYNKVRIIKPRKSGISDFNSAYLEYRQDWQRIVKVCGVKQARKSNGAVYAWLYRNDRPWLLSINADYHTKATSRCQKVNWCERDFSYARKALRIIIKSELNLEVPQRTKTWILTHFKNKSSVEKWLAKLPITNKIIEKYAETTPEYQIRRITRSLINGDRRHTSQLWYLMRMSGLSKERITPLARQFIELLIELSWVRGPTTSIEEISK